MTTDVEVQIHTFGYAITEQRPTPLLSLVEVRSCQLSQPVTVSQTFPVSRMLAEHSRLLPPSHPTQPQGPRAP